MEQEILLSCSQGHSEVPIWDSWYFIFTYNIQFNMILQHKRRFSKHKRTNKHYKL
jgi:hypothetical protein